MVLRKKGKYAIIFTYKLHEFIGQSEHHDHSGRRYMHVSATSRATFRFTGICI